MDVGSAKEEREWDRVSVNERLRRRRKRKRNAIQNELNVASPGHNLGPLGLVDIDLLQHMALVNAKKVPEGGMFSIPTGE